MTVVALPVQFNVPKEGKEIVDFVAALIADIKAKKSIAELAGELPKLVSAVDGFNQLGEEMKSQFDGDLEGYLVREIRNALR